MMRSVAKADSEELFVAASLLVVIGAGLVAALTGLSMALGAFIAGLLLAETEYRKEVEMTVEPFKGLLLGLFFVSVGIGLDLSLLAAKPVLILGLMLGLMLLNGSIIFGPGEAVRPQGNGRGSRRRCCWPRAASSPSSSCIPRARRDLLDRGLVADDPGLLDPVDVLHPRAGRGRRRAGPARPAARPASSARPGCHAAPKVLVVGYGRVGKLVAEMLTQHGIPWMAVERVPKLIEAGGAPATTSSSAMPRAPSCCSGLASIPPGRRRDDGLAEATEAVVATARAIAPDSSSWRAPATPSKPRRLYELGVDRRRARNHRGLAAAVGSAAVADRHADGAVIASIHQRRDEFRHQAANADTASRQGRRASHR